jgi:hypothetical protein
VVQSLTYHDFKFYLTNFQKSRFAFYDADESLTKYLLIALFNISNTLTPCISGTAKMAWGLRQQNGMPVLLCPLHAHCYSAN